MIKQITVFVQSWFQYILERTSQNVSILTNLINVCPKCDILEVGSNIIELLPLKWKLFFVTGSKSGSSVTIPGQIDAVSIYVDQGDILGPKCVRFTLDVTHSELFYVSFQYILAFLTWKKLWICHIWGPSQLMWTHINLTSKFRSIKWLWKELTLLVTWSTQRKHPHNSHSEVTGRQRSYPWPWPRHTSCWVNINPRKSVIQEKV